MKLHHLGFVVLSGGEATKRFGPPLFVEITEAIKDPLQGVHVQFFEESATGIIWEAIWPLGDTERSPLSSRLKRGGGLDHICYELEVGDPELELVLAGEQRAGSAVIRRPLFSTAFGRRVTFVLRRSGAIVEYVERRSPGQSL
jgi:methylmalonyl-CoA/ethylmalonyl-CoA epimerase